MCLNIGSENFAHKNMPMIVLDNEAFYLYNVISKWIIVAFNYIYLGFCLHSTYTTHVDDVLGSADYVP